MIPKVSIIIPIYNVEQYIHRCIDSIINQTLQDIEIILVDDKSPDKCPLICDNYAKKDKRIIVIHKNKNEGLGMARNSGIKVATGEFIAFVDSDDFVDQNMYEDLYHHAKAKKCDTVFCSLTFLKNNHKINFKEVEEETIYEAENIHHFLLDMVGPLPSYKSDVKYMVSVCKAIYSRKIICQQQLLFSSEKVAASEDMLFQIDYIHKAQKICFLPKYYYFYIQNNNSISHTYTNEKIHKLRLFLTEITKKLSLLYSEKEYKIRVYRKYLHYLRIILQIHININHNFLKCLKAIQNECSNKFYQSFLNEYPYKQLPLKHRIFFIAVKYRLSFILWIILKLNSKFEQ